MPYRQPGLLTPACIFKMYYSTYAGKVQIYFVSNILKKWKICYIIILPAGAGDMFFTHRPGLFHGRQGACPVSGV